MKAELELRHLRALLAVVEQGGYTPAARALGLAQSTVSEAVQALERILGTAVLDRSKRPAVLTPAGRAILPFARRMLSLEREAMGAVARASDAVRAAVALAANESVSSYLLPDPLAKVRRRWPKIRVRVLTGECGKVREWLRGRVVDVGLVLGPHVPEPEPQVVLRRTRLSLFVNPGHPLAGCPVGTGRLAEEEFYLSDAAGSYHQLLRRYFEAADFTRVRTNTVGSVEAVKRYVTGGGQGVGVLPEFAVETELAEGAVAPVHPLPPLSPIVLTALLRRGEAPSPMVEDLLHALRTGHEAE